MNDFKQRFSSRVEDYEKYRPSYPTALLKKIFGYVGNPASIVIADIGAGTGIFTKALLDYGATVVAVEPNESMRRAAENKLSGNEKFISQNGSAENTELESNSVDLITAAQALHWFNNAEAKAEFARILNPNGWLALAWNTRKYGTGLQAAYKEVLNKYATDYKVNHQNLSARQIASFFHNNAMSTHSFLYTQEFDFEGVLGSFSSCSYCPVYSSQDYQFAVEALRQAFEKYAVNGRVQFEYIRGKTKCAKIE